MSFKDGDQVHAALMIWGLAVDSSGIVYMTTYVQVSRSIFHTSAVVSGRMTQTFPLYCATACWERVSRIPRAAASCQPPLIFCVVSVFHDNEVSHAIVQSVALKCVFQLHTACMHACMRATPQDVVRTLRTAKAPRPACVRTMQLHAYMHACKQACMQISCLNCSPLQGIPHLHIQLLLRARVLRAKLLFQTTALECNATPSIFQHWL